jgi:hypothetical protein
MPTWTGRPSAAWPPGSATPGQVCIKVSAIFVEAPAHAPSWTSCWPGRSTCPPGTRRRAHRVRPGHRRPLCRAASPRGWTRRWPGARGARRAPARGAAAPAHGARRRAGGVEGGREEIFGPVVAVWPVADWEAGLSRVNCRTVRASGRVFTRDLRRVRRRSTASRWAGSSSTTPPTSGATTCPTAA